MEVDSVFRAIAIALFALVVVTGMSHRIRAARSGDKISRREEGTPVMVALRLSGLVTWLAVLAYLANPEWMRWSALALPVWVRWLGVALVAASVPLVYWVFSSLGRNVTDTVAIRKEHALVTYGPYRWVRHPLYTTAAIFFLGFSLLSASWFIALMLVPTILLLAIRTPIEEAKLIERFGDDYRAYMQRTGRFIPRFS
jgi:protein-S-isoprenylcysteine O-methyltransferase Ste14